MVSGIVDSGTGVVAGTGLRVVCVVVGGRLGAVTAGRVVVVGRRVVLGCVEDGRIEADDEDV